jgi:pyruvate dehydrogenase E2 component (dihydrolipoamide acetyltransferase)
MAFMTNDLALGFPSLGLTSTPFGSAMVTSVGMLGLPMGFAPLSWMYKVPILVLAGEISDRPVAVAGKVEVRPVLPITATIDHRYADGWHISQMLRPFRAYLESPAAFEPEIPGPTAPAGSG